jgi:hypothetical protein
MINKILFSATILILLGSQTASGQHLLSDSLLVHYSKTQTDSIFTANAIPFSPNTGINCYRLIYSTLNAKQTDTTIASGLVIVPDTFTCPLAIAMYDHGTVLQKFDVPSNLNYESLIPMILAEEGYYAIAPDYLGLGVSPGFHPYVHARSEARAGIDLIFAAKSFAATNNIPLSQQLFLTGYSQGGHACMATHRAIQQNYAGQLTVTASAPGSGPYNLSGIQAAGLADNSYYANPSYMPYLVLGYQSVYGNLYDSIQQFLMAPWDSVLPPLYNGVYSTDTIDGLMPHHVDSFVVNSQLVQYNTDSVNDPLRIDLRDNDVYAWVPTAPIQMTYCTADEQVIYQSALFAYNYFLAHGDSAVYAVDGGAFNHFDCVTPAITNMLTFFNQFHVSENNLVLAFTADSESTSGSRNASVKVSVTGGTGYTISWSTGSTDSLVTGLSDGTYTVTVTDARGCTKVRSLNTNGNLTGITALKASTPQLQIFPNPSFGQLSVKVADFRPEVIAIYDVNGQKISETIFSPQLDISKLSQGIYVIEVKSEQATARNRFVKM